jgi:hypothetical protein
MGMLLNVVSVLLSLGSLVCFIMVLIQMFQRGKTGLGIACIILAFFCGIGALIAFIYGWMNATEWGIKNVMLAWTACIVVGILVGVAAGAMGVAAFPGMPAGMPVPGH